MKSSLYFHIPFCTCRCGYCDFITFSGFERLIPDYMSGLKTQVSQVGYGQPIHTIYFGGGTPSLVPGKYYQQLFSKIADHFSTEDLDEISLEANPGTVGKNSLAEYREAGFNRISFGMQSARENELNLLDRSHSIADVEEAIKLARSAGFDNLNLDLIFGLPDQTLADWQYSLEYALQFTPEHLSLYSLIVEEGTPLANLIEKQTINSPNDDMAAEQYEWACERLEKAGYRHYEISNWAKIDIRKDFQCKHNLQYWRLQPYFGFGVGSVGFLPACSTRDKTAYTMSNEMMIGKYIKEVTNFEVSDNVRPYLKPNSELFEKETFFFVGFRLLEEGVNLVEYNRRFQSDPHQDFGGKINKLIKDGLIEQIKTTRLRLTKKGWLLANQVFREFSNIEK